MNDYTINGKSVSQIFEELAEFEATTEKTFQGFDYREIEDFYTRLWNVVGKENVNVTSLGSSAPVFTTLPTGQVICSAYVEIELFYDNGTLFRKVGSWGESELIYSAKGEKFDGIGNIIDTASAKAVKLALKKLDIFGNYSRAKDNKSSGSKKSSSKPSQKKSENKPVVEGGSYSVRGIESAVVTRTDKNTNLPVYTWKCSVDGQACNVVFYPNKYTKYDDWMTRLVAQLEVKPTTLVNMKAKSLGEKDGVLQLVFDEKE